MKPTTLDAYRLLHDGVLALAEVERVGIRIDEAYLDRTLTDTAARIAESERALQGDRVWKVWKRRYGDKANLDSGEQLAKVIFGDMGFTCKAWTAGGSGTEEERLKRRRPKTDETAFDEVDLPFVKDYFLVKKLKKVHGTYLKGIKREIVDGFIHPVFNLHLARTFRSSADAPSFQNLPIRDPVQGELVRRCFVPRKGRHFVEVDYSGIEVRVASCYHHDPNMVRYIEDKTTDMHRDMAAEVYMIAEKDVSKQARYCAKNQFVFPQFYGSAYFQCAKALWEALTKYDLRVGDEPIKDHLASKGIKSLGDCDPKSTPRRGTFEHHVREIERDFWGRRFKVYDSWKKSWYGDYSRRGWFDMLTGFRVTGHLARNDVINYPVQGAAFHCLLQSLIWLVRDEMPRLGLKSRAVGQIHDSILLDCPGAEVDEVIRLCNDLMTRKLPESWKWLCVPLEVEVETSNSSWHEKTKWEGSL